LSEDFREVPSEALLVAEGLIVDSVGSGKAVDVGELLSGQLPTQCQSGLDF
jgi:hypothetical protein